MIKSKQAFKKVYRLNKRALEKKEEMLMKEIAELEFQIQKTEQTKEDHEERLKLIVQMQKSKQSQTARNADQYSSEPGPDMERRSSHASK